MRTLIALTALSLASFSAAQVETPTNMALRIGVAYPIDNTTRDAVKNFIGAGLDYRFDRSLVAGGETYLSADWLGKSGSGAKGNAFPIMLNQKWFGKGENQDDQLTYFFLGAGVAIVDVTSTKTVLAARAGVGRMFGEHIFGELNIVLSDDANGARANSVGVYLGYRF